MGVGGNTCERQVLHKEGMAIVCGLYWERGASYILY